MMITNFALSLSVDGIELLQRVPRGWRRIGRTDVASERLSADLTEMREKAEAMAPEGLRTKLVIPADQIKYTAIDSTLTTMDDIHAMLDGATPYTLDELVIDYEKFGGRTQIAAVARETLDEAEAFAQAHGFNPVSFVAISEPFTFQREVFFGPSKMMPALLGPDGKVQADALPVMIVGTRLKSRLLVFDLPDEIKDQDDPENLADLFAARIDAAEAMGSDSRLADISDTDVIAPQTDAADITAETPGDAPAPRPSERGDPPQPVWIDKIVTEYHAPAIALPKVPLVAVDPVFADLPLFDAVIAEFHAGVAKTPKTPLVAQARTSPTGATKAAPAANRTTAPASSKSRTPAIAAGIAACALVLGGVIWSQIAPTRPDETAIAATSVQSVPAAQRQAATPPSDVVSPALPELAATDFGTAAPRDTSLPAIAPIDQVTKTPAPERVLMANADEAPAAVQAPPPAPAERSAEAMQDGLVRDGTVLSPDAADRIYEATGVWQRAPRFFDVPSGVIALDFSTPAASPPPDRIAQPDIPLPDGLQTDLSFIAPVDPPDPGIVFPRDDDGFILATPEGTLTPDGAMVFAGLPDLTITPRPTLSQEDLDRMALLVPAPEGVVIIAGPPAVVPPLRPEDAALPAQDADAPSSGQSLTPGSVGLAGLELEDSGAVNLDTVRVENGSATDLRPQLRPQELSVAANNATPDITKIIAGIEADDATLRFDSSTSLAVSASLRPAPRPRNFDSIIANARTPSPETQTAAAAPPPPPPPPAAAPVEPQNFAPVPGGVARAATQEDAIRLREINLIGVYGRPNARRALVRLSNGRYVRVEVGSELDGGQVTAIGDSALNFVKRGRTYAIELPAG